MKAKSAPRNRVDYKEILSPEDFELFAKLRELRKELAAEEAVPVYAVCTNEQLAEIAKQKPETVADLKKIDGLGKAKMEKYGERLAAAVDRETRESGDAAREKGENDGTVV